MRNTQKTIAITLSLLTIVGCTSKPREVSASLPLVSLSQEKPNKKEIPSQYWAYLSDSQSTSFKHDKYQVQLSSLYTSALGQVCRELTLIDKESNEQRRTACEASFVSKDNQADKAWFLEKQIIESRVYVEL